MSSSEEKYNTIREFIAPDGQNVDLHNLCELFVDVYEKIEKFQRDMVRIKFDLPGWCSPGALKLSL